MVVNNPTKRSGTEPRTTERPLRAADRTSRRITIVMVMVGIMVLLVAAALPSILTTSSTTASIQHGTDLQGCRALYSAAVTDARTTLDLSIGNSQALQDEFLANIGTSDKTVYGTILKDLGTAKTDLQAAAKEYRRQNDIYQTATKLSNANSDQFLSTCRRMFAGAQAAAARADVFMDPVRI